MAMEPLKKILVALDGSDRSFEAIKYIAKVPMFRNTDAEFCLFGIYDAMPRYMQDMGKDPMFRKTYSEVQHWENQKKRDLRDFLEKCGKTLVDAGIGESNVKTKYQKKKVGIARDIIAEAKSGYGALMIGRKGAGVMKNVVLGSTAMKLLSAITDMPLALVGRDIPTPGKIIVAMDNSEYSMRAVDFVAANLSGKDYKIHLVHAVRDDVDTPAEMTEHFIDEIAPVLNEAKARLVQSGFAEDSVVIKILTKQRSRAKAVMDEAENEEIGTIMTGRRGLNKVVEFFMGRVSNKIVQMARFNAVWVVT